MKNKIGDVSSTYINSLIVAGESLGVDRGFILRENNLSEQGLNDPDCRLSLVALMKVGQSIIHSVQEPALGLIAGSQSVLTALGYPGLLAMNA
ncbi:MAG: AraC family transcriptional regulator, partial [Gammaproteobacteria bacterium]